MMEGVGVSHGVQQSASVLERFYSAGPLISSNTVSLLQDMEGSEAEAAAMQEEDGAGEGEERKNGVMSSLRSPIAGDLASPHHYIDCLITKAKHCDTSSASSHSLVSSTQTYVAIKVSRAGRGEGREGTGKLWGLRRGEAMNVCSQV